MRKWLCGVFAAILLLQLATPVYAALPAGTGMITSSANVSGSEFSSKSSIAKKLDKMFAGNIGLYKDAKKTTLVDAALGTSNVPNNNVYQYWGPDSRAGTSCFAYANAFYGYFYDGVYPHHSLNSNHKVIKATGKITYKNFVKWGVRNDAAVYIREGNHSIIVLHYNEDYITYVDGNGNAKGLIALRKEAWKRGKGANIYDQKPSLIVQPTTSYFAAGSMNSDKNLSCTQGGSDHDWDEGQVTKTASCKETGTKLYTCLDCGKEKEENLKKTADHSYGDFAVTKEATCTQKGKSAAVCALCGGEKTKTIKALGHQYGKTTVVQVGTIYSPGITQKTCARCGYTKKTKSDCIVRDEAFGITLSNKEGVFPKKTTFTVTQPTEQKVVEILLQEVSARSFLFLLDTRRKDAPVQPKGAVQLELTIPEGFGSNLGLYQVVNGTLEPIPITLDRENGVLMATLERFEVFALCDLDVPFVPPEPEPTQPEPTAAFILPPETQPTAVEAKTLEQPAQVNRELLLWLCLVAGLSVICLTFVIVLIVRRVKRKKAAAQTTEEIKPA